MRTWSCGTEILLATFLCVALCGCVPIVERQYNASLDASTGGRFRMGCYVDGGITIKTPEGVEIAVEPPTLPGMARETIGLAVSVPARHTAKFLETTVQFTSNPSGLLWKGTLTISNDQTLSSEFRSRFGDSSNPSPTGTMFGYSTNYYSGGRRYEDSVFKFRIDSGRPFENEFSMRLPEITLDGMATTLPVVHFKYGVGVGVCGLGAS